MIEVKTRMGFSVTLPDSAGDCAVEMLKMNYEHEKMILNQKHEKEMEELKAEYANILDSLAARGYKLFEEVAE